MFQRRISLLLTCLVLLSALAYGQDDILRRVGGAGRYGKQTAGKGDSLAHRSGMEDSITINFRYLDTSRLQKFDSTLWDFSRKFPAPWNFINLGNVGTAAHDIRFSPRMTSGFDHGFHAFDLYEFKLSETRFYNTTRPYSEFAYLLGSQAEQMINLLHTQNVMPNWNLAFQYRMINSPGFFQNQNTNHNNYKFNSWYQSKNRRYQNFFVLLGNKLQASENGGIKQDGNYLDSVPFEERSTIPVNIGPNAPGSRNLFNTTINTGSKYTASTYMMRQQYDLGQKDSIVTDTVVIPLFYPRVRLEHDIIYRTFNYRFVDNEPDSQFYHDNYSIADSPGIYLQDKWKVLTNDFSIYTFPDAKNPAQFLKLGAAIQNMWGTFDSGKVKLNEYNFMVHGEYRNRTRNRKWDFESYGDFYVNGFNAGDYQAYISLKRLISRKLGYLELGFQNVNRTPSFIFDPRSTFYLSNNSGDFNKENTIRIFGSIDQPGTNLKLQADYLLISNYLYFRDYYHPDQASTIFNVLRISAEKHFRLSRRFIWKTRTIIQQKAGDAPVNLPFLFTWNQLGYDGTLGFKNLELSTGIEIRYFTPYKADAYSPVNGQFFYQDEQTVQMDRPELHAYAHFRIRSFSAYVWAENLNSLKFGAGFTNNNVLVIGYPSPGLQFRVGIFWSFVN